MAVHPNNLRREESAERLDRIDRAILSELSKNARLSNKELAARVDLAESSCLERVRRLSATNVLRGFHAEVDRAAIGLGLQAMIAIRLRQHSLDLVRRFQEHLHGLTEVVAVYHVGGADDFLVHVAVRDTLHLKELALESFAVRPEVAHMEIVLVFEHRMLPLDATLSSETPSKRKGRLGVPSGAPPSGERRTTHARRPRGRDAGKKEKR